MPVERPTRYSFPKIYSRSDKFHFNIINSRNKVFFEYSKQVAATGLFVIVIVVLERGLTMKRKKNLKKLLNLGILDYTNLTTKIGDLDMPYVCCSVVPEIDYLATYSQPATYFKTKNTCVSFFEYDAVFDGLYGLWNGIRYGILEIQEFYKERFRGVKYFVSPDYSKCGDSVEVENQHRQFQSRIVSIWLTMNTDAIVIPLVSCANSIGMNYMLDGMHDCNVVAFNAKGPMGDSNQLGVFKSSIKSTVDLLPNLESIVVYSASPDINKIYDIFSYAVKAGIKLQVPNNMLQTRNRIKGSSL